MVSAMFATVLVLLSLTVVAAVVDSDRVIHVLLQAKRSLANGRWGLRPGKRSVALTDDLTCDARSIDGVRMELAGLLEKLLLYTSHLRDCDPAFLLTNLEDGEDADE